MTDQKPGRDLPDLEVRVEVWLASEEVPLGRLFDLQPGGTLSLSTDPDEPVDLVVNDTVVASGELVIIDGKFGLRVTSCASPQLETADVVAAEEVRT